MFKISVTFQIILFQSWTFLLSEWYLTMQCSDQNWPIMQCDAVKKINWKQFSRLKFKDKQKVMISISIRNALCRVVGYYCHNFISHTLPLTHTLTHTHTHTHTHTPSVSKSVTFNGIFVPIPLWYLLRLAAPSQCLEKFGNFWIWYLAGQLVRSVG